MPDLRTTIRELRTTRRALERASTDAANAGVRVARERAVLERLERNGADADRVRTARRAVEEAMERRRRARAAVDDARTAIDRLRDGLFEVVTPESLVAQLDGKVPIVLFPVRLETRYSDDRRRLRIRIFPDAVNVHSHEDALTELEVAHGTEYWTAAWSGDSDDQAKAWQLLVGRRGAPRARFIVDATTPTNLADLGTGADPSFPTVATKAEPWTLPPRAVALPDRYLAVGLRGGQVVFSKWGATVPDELAHGPAPDPEEERAVPEEELPIDDGMRWLVEYDAAEKAGMAITVGPGDHQGGAEVGSLDHLFVVGLDVTLPPAEAAQRIEQLFAAHLHTEGTEFLRPGIPTNNTSRVGSAYDSSPAALAAALDPANVAEPPADAGARLLAAALGVAPETFDDVPGASYADQGPAADMNEVLWEASWGYYFDHLLHPSVSDAQEAAVRRHFREFVRGRGPLPALRVGDQPYGFLPVQAFDAWQPGRGEATEQAVAGLVKQAKGFWRSAADRSPRMGRSGDPDTDLLEVLRFSARSSSFRFRTVTGGVVASNLEDFQRSLALSEAIGQLLLATLHVENTPLEIVHAIAFPLHRRLSIPTVQREDLSETEGLVDNYIDEIAQRVRREGGFDQFLKRSFWFDKPEMATLDQLRLSGILVAILALEPPALLEALLNHAATIEIAKASARLVDRHEVEAGIKEARAVKVLPAEPELVTTDAATMLRFAEAKAPSIAGNVSLKSFLATAQLHQRPETRQLNDFLQALRRLATLPSAELERLMLDTIDCTGTRLDAWVTSFATKRLRELRERTPHGSHIGAFGWVEDLHPDRLPDSLGYIHAPSLPQAATAAILRSGHLSHRGEDAGLFDLDLSSERVRVALTVLDGARQGQRLTALLGYRFERNIRERDVNLAQYILPFRRACPLATTVDGEPTEPVEAIAARDVVDGLKLLERFRSDATGLLSAAGVGSGHREAIREELERLDGIRDAVSDVLVAEGVYQTVLGNTERAGAALAAIDQQAQPPEPQVVKTPRSGTDYTHRVMVVLQDTGSPPGWGTLDPRARAAPRVNRWVGLALGNPNRIRFAADVLDAEGARLRGVEVRLADLDLSPLSVLAATARGGSDQATELEQRVAMAMSAAVDTPGAASLALLPGRQPGWAPSSVGLIELLAMCSALRDVVSGSRPADGLDFAVPNDDAVRGIDVADLAGRADAAAAEVQNARDDLDAAITAAAVDDLRDALERASAVGVVNAVPVAAGGTSEGVAALTDQAKTARDALDAVLAAIAEAVPAEPDAAVRHHTARLQRIFGQDFPVLPLFDVPSPSEMAASLGARDDLTAGDPLAPTTWLHRIGHVQTGSQRLWQVLDRSEVAGGGVDAAELDVVQLPHVPGARWLALPFAGGTPVAAEVSIVAHTAGQIRPNRPMAAVMVDEWVETVPGTAEITGVSFHYDAPGSRPPQTVLVAVPPAPDTRNWSVDLVLATVREALELTKVRVADPVKIPHVGRFLPALYFAQNAKGETPTINFAALQNLEDALERAEREEGS